MERTPQTKTLKCVRCHVTKEVPESWTQKSCPDCIEEMRQTSKRLYQKVKDELPEECRIFRANFNDPFVRDGHLPYCSRCKVWWLNHQKAQNSDDYWGQERAAQQMLGVSGGENQSGWTDVTDQNDQDILDAIGPPKKKEEGEN